jgi:ribosome-binding protein aMBF1 (putative translation factor)
MHFSPASATCHTMCTLVNCAVAASPPHCEERPFTMSINRTSGQRPTAKPRVPAEVQQEFGRQLRETRIAADITLAELVERTGIQPSHISEIENGLRNVTIETMSRLAGGGRPRASNPADADSLEKALAVR